MSHGLINHRRSIGDRRHGECLKSLVFKESSLDHLCGWRFTDLRTVGFPRTSCPSLNNAALWTVLFLKIARKLFSISLCIRLKRRRLSMILVSVAFFLSLPYYKCFHLIANDRNQFSWTKWNWTNIEEKSAFKEMKRNSTYKWRLHALAVECKVLITL